MRDWSSGLMHSELMMPQYGQYISLLRINKQSSQNPLKLLMSSIRYLYIGQRWVIVTVGERDEEEEEEEG